MYNDSKTMPQGLLKEIPGKANTTARDAKRNALQRRLTKTTEEDETQKRQPAASPNRSKTGLGLPINNSTAGTKADTSGFGRK
jgi:hypothetical protein